MVRLPALCTECGAVYPSPLRARSGESDVAFGVPVRCPGCGAGGRVPPEVMQRIRAMADALRAAELAPGRAEALLDELEAACRAADSREEAVRDALRRAPELGRLAGALPGEDPAQMAVAVRLARVAAELVAPPDLESADETPDLEPDDGPPGLTGRIVREAYERWAPERSEPEEETAEDRARSRLEEAGRNDPCPCGSGEKYKRCHWVEDLRLARG